MIELDRNKFAEIKEKALRNVVKSNYHPEINFLDGFQKYLDLDRMITESVNRCHKLGLANTSGLDILDIATGFGYFPFVAQSYGHRVESLDEYDDIYSQGIVDLLKINRKVFEILPFKPLPDYGKKFDLITMFFPSFVSYMNEPSWGKKEWIFLLDNMLGQLKPNGKIYLELLYRDEFIEYIEVFTDRGMKVEKNKIWFNF
jgi:SAM-dependent methyltransferase